METRLVLRPGDNGTKKLAAEYGDRLLCVRYLYDKEGRRRLKTVELIVEEAPWEKPAPSPGRRKKKPGDVVGIRVEYWETDLRSRVKAAGAIWRPRHHLWEMSFALVQALGLEDRVVET